MTDLKPCPFCGEIPTDFYADEMVGGKWGAVVCCIRGPEVRTHYGPVEEWREAAIVAWNQRASGWRDIATAPKDDRTIMRPHVIWGPMTVQRSRFKQKEFPWMNPGMTTVWPEDAFLPFWMPLEVPDCPLCGLTLTGGCRCGKVPALPTMDELPPKEDGANG